MNRLRPLHTAITAGITFVILNAICALAFALSPDATFRFFERVSHGVDLSALKPAGGYAFILTDFLLGLAGVGITAFAAGLLFAVVHNLLLRNGGK